MASTAKEEKYARTYYKTHKKYREDKIKKRSQYAQNHKKEEAKRSKKYYWENAQYRSYKRKYARDYQKRHK
jgi:hypothetical protein